MSVATHSMIGGVWLALVVSKVHLICIDWGQYELTGIPHTKFWRCFGLMVSVLVDWVFWVLVLARDTVSCSWPVPQCHSVTVPLSTQEYKHVPVNCWGKVTNCGGVTCDGLASHPGRIEILPAASCYRILDKLPQPWASQLQGFTVIPISLCMIPHNCQFWLRVCQVWKLLPNQMGPYVSHGETGEIIWYNQLKSVVSLRAGHWENMTSCENDLAHLVWPLI